MKPQSKTDTVHVLQFAAKDIPEYKETTSGARKIVNYGADNKFPDYLLELYSKSPKHGAIVKGKAMYIAGSGFEFKDKQSEGLNESLKTVNRYGESLNKVGKKCILDNEIFYGFYLQIIYGKGGKVSDVLHVDYNKIRSNADNSIFYYKEDWKKTTGEVTPYPCFNPDKPTGTQILYYKGYRAGIQTYTIPDYLNSQMYIESDILVAGHVLNNANSGFTGSKMISFNDGEPSPDEARTIETKLNDKFTGSKGSKLVVNFSANPNVAPTVLDLGASDMSKENFTPVDELISQNIFTGHQIVSPMLFGVRVEGQLGGRNEMREAYEIFKNTYINNRQQEVEEVFNTVLALNGLPEVRIVPVEPIGYEFSEQTIVQVAPKAYILEKLGINPNDYAEDDVEPEAKDEAKNAPEQVEEDEDTEGEDVKSKTKKKEKFSSLDDELALTLFSQVGEDSKGYFRYSSKKVCFHSDEECRAGEIQGYRQAFAEITILEANIIDLLKKDKRATPEVIAKALEVSPELVQRVLRTLSDKGMIKVGTEKVGDEKTTTRDVTEGGKEAISKRTPTSTEVFIKYSYEGPEDERNRDFCAHMLDLDKIYSRVEIEQISQRLGYSVWERRGGFYTNSVTGETTPYCRHYWMQHIVLKRK